MRFEWTNETDTFHLVPKYCYKSEDDKEITYWWAWFRLGWCWIKTKPNK